MVSKRGMTGIGRSIFIAIALASSFSAQRVAAQTPSGEVRAWGYNGDGELGNGTPNPATPQ